ncbi:hypothetical protein V4S32_14060 [Enterococcus cecorum]
MYLATLLLFDQTALEEKQDYVHQAEVMANQVYDNEATLQAIVDQPFERIIYLGSGCLVGLTREAQLKVLGINCSEKLRPSLILRWDFVMGQNRLLMKKL